MDEPESMSAVAGRNARRFRLSANATLDDVSRAARIYGLKWSNGNVGDFESGRVSTTVATLFAVAQTLGDVTGTRISLPDLLSTEQWVRVNSSLVIAGPALHSAMVGDPVDLSAEDTQGSMQQLGEIARASLDATAEWEQLPAPLKEQSRREVAAATSRAGLSERRIAQQLEIGLMYLSAMSLHLWGRSFTDERDARSVGDNSHSRGRASRVLKEELRVALEAIRGDH
jgi:transcriptional regulator with XRE-family HTH domain